MGNPRLVGLPIFYKYLFYSLVRAIASTTCCVGASLPNVSESWSRAIHTSSSTPTLLILASRRTRMSGCRYQWTKLREILILQRIIQVGTNNIIMNKVLSSIVLCAVASMATAQTLNNGITLPKVWPPQYQEKYPDIIKPIYETENQYSKHDGSLGRIMREHTHGKYVAFCEGDDYWTDPLKLQKQVECGMEQ